MPGRSVLHLRLPAKDKASGQSFPGPSLAEFCRRTTPVWELSTRGAYLDLTGTERMYGRGIDGAAFVSRLALDRLGGDDPDSNLPFENISWSLAAGEGPTRLAAGLASLTAARAGGGVFAILPGQVTAFLQPFPVDFLPARRSVVSRLRKLGVRTLGDLQVVPRTLLGSVFGPDGSRLAEEALGNGTGVIFADKGTGRSPVTGLELVVGVRLPRPVSSGRVMSALCRGMAVRALTCCPGGPASRGRWDLTTRWADGNRDSVTIPGPSIPGWSSWYGLLELLWKRLPVRRQGLLAAELRAKSPAQPLPRQGILFASQEADNRLEEVLRFSSRESTGRLQPASDGLLVSLGAVWYGPGAGMSKPGQGYG